MDLPMSLRTADSEQGYQDAKTNGGTVPLTSEPHLLNYEHWYLIKNRFPYDVAFREHDMLLPRSGVATRAELSINEAVELTDIIEELSNQYDLVFENFTHRRSVLTIYHVHLGLYKGKREEMSL